MTHEFKSVLDRPWALVRSNQPGSNDQPGKRPGANIAFFFGRVWAAGTNGRVAVYEGCEVKRVRGRLTMWEFQYKRTRRFTEAEIFHRFGHLNMWTATANQYAGPDPTTERRRRRELPKAPQHGE